MSRSLILIIIAILIVIFAVSRFVNYDFNLNQQGVPQPRSVQEDPQFLSWITFNSKNQSFTAKLPREPEHVSQDSPDLMNRSLKHYEIYAVSGLDSSMFIIQEITFLKGSSPDQDPTLLATTLKDILASTNSTLVKSDENATFQGYPAIKFELERNKRHTEGVIFAKGKVLYILSRTIKDENRNKTRDYQYFLDSFKFNDSTPNTDT